MIKVKIITHGSKSKAGGAEGKGRKIPVHSRISFIIKRYYKETETGFLFESVSKKYEDFTPEEFKKMPEPARKKIIGNLENAFRNKFYDKLLSETDFEYKQNLTPHCTRHTFETRMRNAGARQDITNAIAGHACGHVSDIYTHFTEEQLIAEIEKVR